MAEPKANRRFTDLSEDELKQIVNDIFGPEKVTYIKKHEKDDTFTCNIYTRWTEEDTEGERVSYAACNELEIGNPWTIGSDALYVDIPVGADDYTKLKQFCIAKGIFPDWMADNPYANS